jgi:glucose/arabinose dehydrogenase
MPQLTARRVASGLSHPVFATSPPGDLKRLFIVERMSDVKPFPNSLPKKPPRGSGRIRILHLDSGKLNAAPFLQIDDLPNDLNEQGLLGLAFHPDFATNGRFYVNFTLPGGESGNGVTHVRQYRVSADPDVADPASATTVIAYNQPFANHNGGWLAFGPRDGFLYIAAGDGGNADDPGNRAQNLGSLFGKLLRIDVNGDDFPGDPNRNYAIPPTNPFVGRANVRPEIWAFGLRNPWRNSFDRQTGDLYVGDVGQGKFEEIDFQPASSRGGENYGWSFREGKHKNEKSHFHPTGTERVTEPIHEYDHGDGLAVIGGYVYRGSQIAGLQGTYFLADHSGPIWSFRFDGGAVSEFTDRTEELTPNEGAIGRPSSFGEDAEGELYIMGLKDPQDSRLKDNDDELFKISPAS